jgi:integrase
MAEKWRRVWSYGDWWLAERPGAEHLQICTYDKVNRQVRRRSIGTADLRQAQERLVDHVIRSAKLQHGDPRDVPIAAVLIRYWHEHGQHLPSRVQVRVAGAQLVEALGEAVVADLTPQRQRELIRQLGATGRGPSTVARIMSVLRAALNLAWKNQELATPPPFIFAPKAAPARERVATVAELAKLWDAAEDDYLRMWLILALATGARRGAILELHRDQCDTNKRLIRLLPHGRSQDARKRRPVVRMAEHLVPWIESVEAGPLVTYRGRPLDNIKAAWRRAIARAELPADLTPNVIRHSIATRLREAGVDEAECAAFLGHRWTNSTTEGYAKHRPAYQRQAAAVTDCLISEIARGATRAISGRGSMRENDMNAASTAEDESLKGRVVGATGIEPVTPTMST